MTITITEKAASEVKRIIQERQLEEDTGLRIGVAGGGCSGFEYTLGFSKDFDEKADHKYNQYDLDVVIDRKSYLYLEDIVLDFYDDGLKRGFTFNNPNATKSCGCGSSFSV